MTLGDANLLHISRSSNYGMSGAAIPVVIFVATNLNALV
jgi:hypothetical protein